MAIANKLYPRSNDTQTIYLKNVITRPNINVGDYTIYNDFINDPRKFEENNYYIITQSTMTNSLLKNFVLLPVM